MRKIIISATLLLCSVSYGKEMPFTISYDSQGQVERIEIKKNSLRSMEANEFIDGIKGGIEELSKQQFKASSQLGFDFEGFEKLKPEEQEAFLEAKSLASNKDVSSPLDDPKLRKEFNKSVKELLNMPLFYLVASPKSPGDFDKENVLVEALNNMIDVAQNVFGLNPIYNAYEFLIEEYFEALISRREFVQNAVLAYLDSKDCTLNETEKNKIRSSIFYSRIEFYNIPKREKAAKKWSSYGVDAQKKWMKKCKNTEVTWLNDCFTHDGKKIYNLVDKSFKFSRKPSTAFSYENPISIAVKRVVVIAAKFVVKMLPAPGLIKNPIRIWLESHYRQQRRTEGLLYSSSLISSQDNLAAWIKYNTVNPTWGL